MIAHYGSAEDAAANIYGFIRGEENLKRVGMVDENVIKMNSDKEWAFSFVARNEEGQLRTFLVTVNEMGPPDADR